VNERLLLFISALVEVLIAYQLFSHFFIQKESNTVKLVLISIGLVLVLAGVGVFKILLLNTFMSLLLYILFILIIFRCKWWQASLWSVVFVLLGMVSEIATSFGVSFAFNVHIENTMVMTWYKLIVYIISKSILYILVKIIITVFHTNKEIESDKTVLYLILFPVLAILNEYLLFRLTMQLDLSRGTMAFSVIIGIGLIFGGFLLISLYDHGLQKKQLEKELLLAQSKADANEKFFLLQERNLKEARSTVHDFKNQLINLKALYEDSSTDAVVYHENIMDSLRRQMNWQLIDVNNRVFSNILMRVQIRCEQMGIDFNSKISLYDLGFIDPIDTSSIFDNAFDNAIYACAEMDKGHKRWICFKLYKTECFLVCEVANSYTKPINTNVGDLVSSKEDKEHHGIGVKNIQATAYKYGGDIAYSYNDSEFQLSIRLPFSK
jgi:two-component system sensor histidine kinase AgrC